MWIAIVAAVRVALAGCITLALAASPVVAQTRIGQTEVAFQKLSWKQANDGTEYALVTVKRENLTDKIITFALVHSDQRSNGDGLTWGVIRADCERRRLLSFRIGRTLEGAFIAHETILSGPMDETIIQGFIGLAACTIADQLQLGG